MISHAVPAAFVLLACFGKTWRARSDARHPEELVETFEATQNPTGIPLEAFGAEALSRAVTK